MHLSDLITGFFLARKNELAATTRINYGYCRDRLIEHFGAQRDIRTITATEIQQEWIEALRARGMTNRSICDNLAIASSFWEFAALELGIENVVRKVRRPAWHDQHPDPYTQAEMRALLRATSHYKSWMTRWGEMTRQARPTALRDRAILLTLVDTGIRASELCSLVVADHRTSDNRLHIRRGKGGKTRYVYLGKRAARAVWQYQVTRGDVALSAPLFATRTERHLNRSSLYDMVSVIAAVARVANASVHRFRHTFAINYLRNGGNIYDLQHLLGHEELDTVKTYLMLAQSDIESGQQRASPADNWKL